MKILIHSNSPLVGSGYGNQTFIFSKLLKKAGWDVVVSAYYGLKGNVIDWDGIRILPGAREPWGNDILNAHFVAEKPNVLFGLTDSWILDPDVIKKLPLALWTPVDHDTAPPRVINALNNVAFPIAMSKHGERAMRYHGIDPYYIPHGVDIDFFKPKDMVEARKRFKIDKDTFVVSMNAANRGIPSRKSFEPIFKAWGEFVKRHPNSVLICHTSPIEGDTSYDLEQFLHFYNIADGEVLFPDVYRYVQGAYGWDYLRDLYNASDVFLAPSKGEGFGIPVVEAHACGCPTITTDCTAQKELGGHYQIKMDSFDNLQMTFQYAEQALVLPSQILNALELAYNDRGNKAIREEARSVALPYGSKRVFAEYMEPTLNMIAQLTNVS